MAKLLLVDDNPVNYDMLSRRLKKAGHKVVHAANGVQGIGVANRENPDAILMDLSMPVMNGWEASQQLKSSPQTRHIPIIAVTSHAMQGSEEKALTAGCDAFITKPIDFALLLATIDKVLNLKKSEPDGTRAASVGPLA